MTRGKGKFQQRVREENKKKWLKVCGQCERISVCLKNEETFVYTQDVYVKCMNFEHRKDVF